MATEKMIDSEQEVTGTGRTVPFSASPPIGKKISTEWKSFLLATVVLTICFSLPLYRLVRFALGEELYSYVVLVPFITWYLVRLKKAEELGDSRPLRGTGVVCGVAGVGLMGYYLFVRISGGNFELQDGLALTTAAYILFLFGAALALLGRKTIRAQAFPLGFLAFMIPMPEAMQAGIETFLQYGSAYVAHVMFSMSGVTFLRKGLLFMLPGLPDGILIARECSGIHSTLILFITSLLAGYLFLRSPRNRLFLALAVVPVGLLRNGFRVFTIGQLCVHYGPQMIDSPIHRKGGPLFFVLSLVPFFALLAILYKSERQKAGEVKM